MTKSKLKPSIRCDKCHKWIAYGKHSGYKHFCTKHARDICELEEVRRHAISLIRDDSMRNYEMTRLIRDMSFVDVRYDPESSKSLRKDIEVKKTITSLPTPDEVTRITATLDLASKLDNTAIAKLSSSKGKNSTPKIGELCGMDLLLDLSSAPDETKYELYFKARTILEEVMAKLAK